MAPLNLDDYLFELVGKENFRHGFERVQKELSFLVEAKPAKSKVVIVGGTNGKGETCFGLLEALKKEGKSVALWTSPHVERVNERYLFDGNEIDNEQLWKAIQLCEEKNLHQCLSYYEFLFACFLVLANEKSPDVIILEVGLGGRLDAVNIVHPDLSVIASISRDHQAILGNRYDLILNEKLGITRPDTPLLTSFTLRYLEQLAARHCDDLACEYLNLSSDDSRLKNDYSLRNLTLAHAATDVLLNGFEQTKSNGESWLECAAAFSSNLSRPGRWDSVTLGKKKFIFVGAHNCDGHRVLLSLIQHKNLRLNNIVLGFSDRPFEDVLTILKTHSASNKSDQRIGLCQFEHNRAMDVNDFKNWVDHKNKLTTLKSIDWMASWERTLEYLDQLEGHILVTGSYYFVGEVKKILTGTTS